MQKTQKISNAIIQVTNMDPILIWQFLKQYWKYVAAVVLILFAFYKGYDYRDGIAKVDEAKAVAAWQEVIDKERARRNDISADLEVALSNIKKLETQVNKKVKDEIKQNPAYGSCSIPSSGVQLINSTVREYNQARDTSKSSR